MIWNLLIIGGVVVIFLVLVRHVPEAIKMEKIAKEEVPPEKITMYGLLAQADEAFEAQDFNKAENLYIKACTQEPDNAKIYNCLGQIYLEQGNFYDAKDAFLQTLKLASGNPETMMNLGISYMGLKDYYKSSQTFRDALKIDPKNRKYEKLLERAEKALERERKRK